MYNEKSDDYLNGDRYSPFGFWTQFLVLLAFIMRR
jgi:hypothetical protein